MYCHILTGLGCIYFYMCKMKTFTLIHISWDTLGSVPHISYLITLSPGLENRMAFLISMIILFLNLKLYLTVRLSNLIDTLEGI